MASKKEYKRTMKKLKERVETMPKRVMVKPKRLKRVAKSIEDAKEILKRGRLELKGAREPISSKEFEEKLKAGKIEHREYEIDAPKAGEPPKAIRPTNGVEVPEGLLGLIRTVKDVKAAKAVARAANRWLNRLKAFEEMKMVREFSANDFVWWTKKGSVHGGTVMRLKARKLVVREYTGETKIDWVLPVRKVKKGQVPKEHLMPDPKRWRIGRAKGGETKAAGAAVR